MSMFAMFKSAGPTGFGYGSTAEQVTEGPSPWCARSLALCRNIPVGRFWQVASHTDLPRRTGLEWRRSVLGPWRATTSPTRT
jgi:hypothetical protein